MDDPPRLDPPAYLSTGQIAVAVEESRKRVVTELKHAGLLDRRGGRFRVSCSALRERLPDYYDRVYAHYCPAVRGEPKAAP